MDQKVPSPAEALAEIERTQRAAYSRRRIPIWYVPAVVGAITLLGVGTELHGPARGVTIATGGLAMAAAVYGLSRSMRVRWKARAWTLAAGAEFGAWAVSIGVVMSLTGLIIGAIHFQPVVQRVAIGVAAAVYSVATLRWIERRVIARTAGKVIR
ncbi:MAG TPA: hypothetical protein VFU43_13105 [Streptosporangiaceae bacterium]|nr:hypothetical protein [Streptosporangiaceae bacterium]